MEVNFVNYINKTLKECQFWADIYMIDYFVKDLWHQLLPSWQQFYESQLSEIESDRKGIVDLVKHVLRRPGQPSCIKLLAPEPLSMLALKAVVSNLELQQWKIPKNPQQISSKLGFHSTEASTSFTNLRESLPPALRLKIKAKKEHEVSRIADIARILIQHLGPIDEIVDVGRVFKE